ncbi:MAG: tetratricopeptide repeat protein [Opitutaceae bacterium]|nr:tetratricopeptide repeat protein [Opitutaceae bacterium]
MRSIPSLVRAALVVVLTVVLGGCSAESRKARSLDRAGEAYRAGDLEKARIEYQNVLQKFPEDPTANERLALIWFERGATVRALAFFSRLNLQTPANQPLRLKRARIILGLGRTAEARREAEAILRISKNVPEALLLLTDTIRERDDLKTADEALQAFADKNSVFFQLASANVLILRGDAAGARTALQRALALDPKSPDAHLAMARFFAAQNNPTQALAMHKAAADLAPQRSPIRMAYANYQAQTGALTDATATLKAITEKVPDYLPAWRGLSQVAMQQRRYQDAMTLLQNVLRQDSADVDALILRARVLLATGDAKTAIAELTQFGTAMPGLGIEKHQLALAHLQNQDQASALVALEQTVALFPDNVEAAILLAQLQLRAGKAQPAAELMMLVVNRRPDLLQAHLLLIEAAAAIGRLEPLAQSLVTNIASIPNSAQLRYVLGLVRLRQDKPAEARETFEAALVAAPDLLAATIELFGLDLKEEKTEQALARAQAVAVKFPKSGVGHILTARAQSARGDWAAAEAAAITAIELAPTDPAAYGILTSAYSKRLDQPGTVERLEAFLAKHVGNPLAALMGGQLYMARKDHPRILALYEKHLVANPGSSTVMNNLANLYADQMNNLDKGLELARKARELDPSSPAIADTLGWMLLRKNDARGALPLLQQAARSMPENPEVQFHLGKASLALGDEAGALAAFRVVAGAKADFPDKAEAKAKVAELEKRVPATPAPSGAPVTK